MLGVIVSVFVFHWPLRLSFAFHLREFETLANQVQSGRTTSLPQQIGCFTIKDAAVDFNGDVALWFDPSPARPAGFYRARNPILRPRANVWASARITDHWWLIYED